MPTNTKAWIEEQLAALIETPSGQPQAALYEAARYSLLSGGKRLRPLLTLAAAECFGAPLERALIPACAIELIHTYSLIHDDLPCMDDDDLRRGRPTLHKVYGEGHAVLTGDYLLTYAFEIVATAPDLSALQRLALITALSKAAGSLGIVGGQVVDIASIGKSISEAELHFIHHYKTGALIALPFEFGGIIGNASAQDLTLLKSAGSKLGIAYQIIDDLLDDAPETEKPQAPSAVKIYGKASAEKRAQALLDSAKTDLTSLTCSPQPLMDLIEHLIYRTV